MKLASMIGLASVAAVALLAAMPASAQSLGAGIPLNQDEAKTPEQIEKQKATEDAYRATLKKLPDAKPVDPWGNMRSAEPSTQAKTKIAPKKTNNAANQGPIQLR